MLDPQTTIKYLMTFLCASIIVCVIIGTHPENINRASCNFPMTEGHKDCGKWNPIDSLRSSIIKLVAGKKTYVIYANIKFYDRGCLYPVNIKGDITFMSGNILLAGTTKQPVKSCIYFYNKNEEAP